MRTESRLNFRSSSERLRALVASLVALSLVALPAPAWALKKRERYQGFVPPPSERVRPAKRAKKAVKTRKSGKSDGLPHWMRSQPKPGETAVAIEESSIGYVAPSIGVPASELLTNRNAFDVLAEKSKEVSDRNTANGWGYILSGAAALGVSLPLYYLSEDVFARAVYSLGQTLGVVAVGYGSYLVYVDEEYTRFHRILLATKSLSGEQRNELSRAFLEENANRARNVRKIRVITHGLTAALNFTSGATTSNKELKTALYFIGGINALAAISFTLSKSEEERLNGDVASTSSPELKLTVGQTVGFRLDF